MLIKKSGTYPIICVVLSAILIIISFFSSHMFFEKKNSLDSYIGSDCTIEAMVISTEYDTVTIDGYRIIVNKLNGKRRNHNAVLHCKYDSVLEPGFVFTARVTAEGFDSSSGKYNEELSMLSDSIFISYVSDAQNTVFISNENASHIKISFAKINKSISRLLTSGIEGEAGKLSSALLLGNKNLLSPTTTRDFSRAGVSHVLALSGLHMSIIMGALMFLLKRLLLNSKIISVVLAFCSVGYLLLTGCSVSAARSVIMLGFVYLSIIWENRVDPPTSLALAGFILVLASPGTIADAGFWMSFSATLGLLMYVSPFTEYMKKLTMPLNKYVSKVLVFVSSLFMASVFALVPLIAIMCIFIKELSLFAIIGSAVLAIPTEILIILSLIFLPVAKIPHISSLIASLISSVTNFMLDFCGKISDIDGAVISLNYPFASIAAVILAITIAYSLIFKSRNLFRSLIPFALSLVLLISAMAVYDMSENDSIRISYINSSSKSDMIVLSNRKDAIICDVGNGSYESYRLALDEIYLTRSTEIKAVMLTRYSYAHNATLLDLFQSTKVRQLWVPYPESKDEYNKLAPLKSIAEKQGVEIYVYKDGEDFKLFDYTRMSAFRTYIDRSAVPISYININSRQERFMYLSPAFNEAEIPEEVSKMMMKTEYFVFGNKGPTTKTDYTIPYDNDAELIVFSDKTRAGYFVNDGIYNTTYLLSPEKCTVYLTK